MEGNGKEYKYTVNSSRQEGLSFTRTCLGVESHRGWMLTALPGKNWDSHHSDEEIQT